MPLNNLSDAINICYHINVQQASFFKKSIKPEDILPKKNWYKKFEKYWEVSEKDSKETFEVFKKIFNSLKKQAKDGIKFEIKDKKEKTYTKSFDKKLFKELRKKYKV